MTTMTAPLVTFGETLGLLTGEQYGPLRFARSCRLGFAGSESNVAIGATRLGVASAWMGRVGDDEFGRMILNGLRGEGVDVSAATVDPDVPTALMIKELRTARHRRVIYYRRDCAGSRLSPGALDEQMITRGRILHVSAITVALSVSSRDAVLAAIEIARSAGVPVSVDLNYRAALWPDVEAAGSAMRELARRADIVQASGDEAAMAVGEGDPVRAARALADGGAAHAIVKLGADGAVAVISGEEHQVAAVPVEEVDAVGAGDAFVAGYLSGLIEGLGPEEQLRQAATAGALAVTVPGDWEGLPTRDELTLLDTTETVSR